MTSIRNILAHAIAATGLAVLLAGCGSGPRPTDPVAGLDGPSAEERLAALSGEALADPTNPAWPYRMAQIRAEAGDAARAEAALRAALALDADHPASLALLSKLWWEAQRHEEAIELLEARRVRDDALPVELLAALALHYEAIGRTDLSDGIAASLESRLDDWESAGAALTYVRLRGDGYRETTDVAQRALEARPKSAVNQNNWGIARLYEGDPVEARKAFLTAVDLDPALPGPLYNLAIVDKFYFYDDGAARDWFRRYLALADDDPDGLAEALSITTAHEPQEGNR